MKTQAIAQSGLGLTEESKANPAYQAYQVLHWGFVAAPLLTGIDKFFNILTHWEMYLWAPLGKSGSTHLCGVFGAVLKMCLSDSSSCNVAVSPCEVPACEG